MDFSTIIVSSEYERNDELVRLESNVNGSIHTKIDSMIDSFITDVSSKREKYEISYMKKFHEAKSFLTI